MNVVAIAGVGLFGWGALSWLRARAAARTAGRYRAPAPIRRADDRRQPR